MALIRVPERFAAETLAREGEAARTWLARQPELARGWTLLRAVDYQLWVLRLGLTEDPARYATVIDWLSLAGGP